MFGTPPITADKGGLKKICIIIWASKNIFRENPTRLIPILADILLLMSRLTLISILSITVIYNSVWSGHAEDLKNISQINKLKSGRGGNYEEKLIFKDIWLGGLFLWRSGMEFFKKKY